MQEICKMPALQEVVQIPRGAAGLRYEQQERRQYRDCLLFYCDGRVRFERYCYGEAAGLVFGVWAEEISPEGVMRFAQPFSIEVKEAALPKLLAVLPDGRLQTDGKGNLWAVAATLKTDKPNGYSRLKVLFSKQ